jgi:S1/P1 Nuclease
MMKKLFFLLLPLALLMPLKSKAYSVDKQVITNVSPTWGATGHRVVGEVANSHLTRRAKKRIRKILGNESIAITSNWADFIKSDTAMKYLDPWHYINAPWNLNYPDFAAYLQRDSIVDAFTKLNFMINELKNKDLSMDKKRMYLRLVIHIVGDIHQPLHVGRAEDQGGNKIKVFWFNEPTNLHALWDDKLIEFQKLSYTEYTANINHPTTEQRTTWQAQPMSEWLFESYQLADKVYKSVTQPDQKLSYRYNYDHVEMMNGQLLKGGVRLAGLLNQIFG